MADTDVTNHTKNDTEFWDGASKRRPFTPGCLLLRQQPAEPNPNFPPRPVSVTNAAFAQN
jgi:hypothetical protein